MGRAQGGQSAVAVAPQTRTAQPVVQVNTQVTVIDEASGRSQTFKLISGKANPAEGTLSADSPIGRALAGRGDGDSVTVQLPHGKRRRLLITALQSA